MKFLDNLLNLANNCIENNEFNNSEFGQENFVYYNQKLLIESN